MVLSLIAAFLLVVVFSRPPDVPPPLADFGNDHFCYQDINNPLMYMAGILSSELSAPPPVLLAKLTARAYLEDSSLPPDKMDGQYQLKLIQRGCPSSLPVSIAVPNLKTMFLTINLYLDNEQAFLTSYRVNISRSAEIGVHRVDDSYSFFGLFLTVKNEGSIIPPKNPIEWSAVLTPWRETAQGKRYICGMNKTDKFVIDPTFASPDNRPTFYNSIIAKMTSGDQLISDRRMISWPCPALKSGGASDIIWMLPSSSYSLNLVFFFELFGNDDSTDFVSLREDSSNWSSFTTPQITQKSLDTPDEEVGAGLRIYLMGVSTILQTCHDNTMAFSLVILNRRRRKTKIVAILAIYRMTEYNNYRGIKYIKFRLIGDMSTCIPKRI